MDPHPAACPDEDTLLAFAERRLDSGQAASCRDHLDQCVACRTAVGQLAEILFGATGSPIEGTAGPGTPSRQEAIADPLPERRVIGGRYELGALIGKGGMGAVYEAVQLDLRREVAVKMLKGEAASSPQTVARFQREARLAASIGHENIISVLDVGQTDSGEAFIVMERLHGASLQSVLDDSPISLRRLADIVDQVLAALQAVHGRGIIHRDIKPENVFVVTGEERDRIKVLDFGVSKASRAELESIALTRTGTMIGTPLYMSPEQIVGHEDLDRRADLYAVGVILYRALSGRFPFRAQNLNRLMAEVLSTEPQSLRRVAPWVHTAWERLVSRAIGKLPDERVSDAREFRQALQALPAEALEGQTRPLTAALAGEAGSWQVPLSSGQRAARSRRLALAALGLVALAAGGVFAFRRLGSSAAPVAPSPIASTRPPAPLAPPAPRSMSAPDLGAPVDATSRTADTPKSDEVIRVSVQVDPRQAAITINGEPFSNPVRTQLTRVPGDLVRIEASAPGFRTVTRRQPRDADVDLHLRLPRLRPRPGSTGSTFKVKTRLLD